MGSGNFISLENKVGCDSGDGIMNYIHTTA